MATPPKRDFGLGMGKLGPALHGRLAVAREGDTFNVYISVAGNLARTYLSAASQQKGLGIVRAVRLRAAELQRPVIQYLNAHQTQADSCNSCAETYWINNIIHAEIPAAILPDLLGRTDIEHVELVQQTDQDDCLDGEGKVLAGVANVTDLTAELLAAAISHNTTWSVQRVRAPLLWEKRLTGEGVVVAILDSGVNYQHPDLAVQMWNGGAAFPLHGYNFEDEDHDPIDDKGHGTCCAGIVAGNGKSGLATGVAPRAAIMSVRIDNKETNCWKGMQFALENGAHVINQSLSWMAVKNPYHRGWRRACETILAAGVLHATSAGNKGDWQGPYSVPYNVGAPANCPPPWRNPAQPTNTGCSSAIACGTTDESDLLDDDSSMGPCLSQDEAPDSYRSCAEGAPAELVKPDVCAPGPTDTCNWRYPRQGAVEAYTTFGKTSSATAHLAGSMALLAQACLRSEQPIIPARVQEALENTAVRIRGRQSDPIRQQKYQKENGFGAGRIDVHAAYQYGKEKNWWS